MKAWWDQGYSTASVSQFEKQNQQIYKLINIVHFLENQELSVHTLIWISQ